MSPAAQMPLLTEEHMRQAFEAMHWPGWTYESAMANDIRRRLVVCRAHQLRMREWLEHHSVGTKQNVRRVVLDAKGDVTRWCTQVVMGPRADTPQLDLPIKPI